MQTQINNDACAPICSEMKIVTKRLKRLSVRWILISIVDFGTHYSKLLDIDIDGHKRSAKVHKEEEHSIHIIIFRYIFQAICEVGWSGEKNGKRISRCHLAQHVFPFLFTSSVLYDPVLPYPDSKVFNARSRL